MSLKNLSIFQHIMILLFMVRLLSSPAKSQLTCPLPPELATKLHTDPATLDMASADYGNIIHNKPAGVFYPSSVHDIASLVQSSYNCSTPFGISVRGNGHCTRGQDMALNGVVVDMKGLRDRKTGTGVTVSKNPLFADVGGEQLWIDVLTATAQQGFMPVSWTDYLLLTVGGTLSNAGISGQTFRFGPQINNVYELEVITGKGEVVTCNAKSNPELFYGVLGGLGQFGIITRARIALGPATNRVRWLRMLYVDFSAFTRDQEDLISRNGREQENAVTFLEGQLLLDNGTPNTWETSFFPSSDLPKIMSLVKQFGIIYCIEVATAYNSAQTMNKETEDLLKGLSASGPVYTYEVDVPYVEFLTRVQLTADIPPKSHPWLNLMIPKSRISDFNTGALRDIVLQRNITTGPALLYPMNRNKWDDKMSAVTADEDIFYTLGLLYESDANGYEVYDVQNKAILTYCESAGIKVKQYLPNINTKEEWINHFGPKWDKFQQRKNNFDPKMILSPGQKIFN